MDITFDPADPADVERISQMLGLGAGDAADADAKKELIERLQAQLNEKRQEIAKLKSAANAAASQSDAGDVSERTLASCVVSLADKVLLKWPGIGKGALEKMRAYAEGIAPDAEKTEAKESAGDPPDDEWTSDATIGNADDAASESTSTSTDDDDADGWGDDDEDETPAEPKHSLEELRALVKKEFIAKKRLAAAKAAVASIDPDAKNLDDLKPEDYDKTFALLTDAAK